MEPDNVATFSIMKDATATSLYGARGANGVILVTTKEGKKGKANVSFRGGVESLEVSEQHLEYVDGVMLGRAAYQNPWLLSDVDTRLFGASGAVSMDREAAIYAMLPYIEQQLANGARLHHVTRHMLGLYQGQYGGRQYRRHLSEHAHKAESGVEVLREAMAFAAAPPERAAVAG